MSKASPKFSTDQLYRIATAAALFGVKRSTLYGAAERGELRSYSLGDGLPVVVRADVEVWVEKFGGRPRGKPPSNQ